MGVEATYCTKVSSGILSYDSEWQFPAITEQNAFEMAKRHLFDVDGVVYLAFPWATLLDKYNTQRSSAKPLFAKLKGLVDQIAPNTRVVTVCQHIHMMKFIDVFFEHRVTDIFWTHAVKTQSSVTMERTINLHPFPLYSVQFPEKEPVFPHQKRTHLFSFIGARANQWYLTESRNWILDLLGDDERGLVVGRDSWHFNKIVYDHQIRNNDTDPDKLVDADATEQFKQTLRETTFALCPSGTGPNSIRLWESIAAGSIPVILADTYLPPGRQAIWDQAVVYCKENPEAIKALPDRLEAIANDPERLAHMRQMLGQLWILYGMDPFIYDIQMLYLQIANRDPGDDAAATDYTGQYDTLVNTAQLLSNKKFVKDNELSLFLNACISRLMIDQDGFAHLYACEPAVAGLMSTAMEKDVNLPAVNRLERLAKFLDFDLTQLGSSRSSASVKSAKTPIRVHLYGKHSNRTPLSYEPYLPLLEGAVDFVDTARDADIVMTGFNIDFLSDVKSLHLQKLDNYNVKHVVLSEEPLWDVVWSKGYKSQKRNIETSSRNIPYHFFNHMNSDIYAFDQIPYFLTTDDKFFVRYGNYARRNIEMTASDLLDHWRSAPIRSAFYAEIRENEKYAVKDEAADIYGLCLLRTSIAQNCKAGQIVRVGRGWPKTTQKRQALPDWHLDKLNALDRNVMIVSGLENTHQKHYITEKIFDAFAVNAIPVYCASPQHRIHEIFPHGGFINVFGMTGEQAAEHIDRFTPDQAFAERYRKSQRRMARLFNNPETLVAERRRLVTAFIKHAEQVVRF